jgi:hypothetical protein
LTAEVVGTPVDTTSGSGATSHALNLPTGITIGKLLFLPVAPRLQSADDAVTIVDWTFKTFGRQGSSVGIWVFCREADSTEGSTVTVNLATSGRCTSWCWRLSGADGDVEGIAFSGSTATPDPPELAPSWGAAENLSLYRACVCRAFVI